MTTSVVRAAQAVQGMLEGFHALVELHVSAEHCMAFLEDRLQLMYHTSRLLSTFLLVHAASMPLDATQVCSAHVGHASRH